MSSLLSPPYVAPRSVRKVGDLLESGIEGPERRLDSHDAPSSRDEYLDLDLLLYARGWLSGYQPDAWRHRDLDRCVDDVPIYDVVALLLDAAGVSADDLARVERKQSKTRSTSDPSIDNAVKAFAL